MRRKFSRPGGLDSLETRILLTALAYEGFSYGNNTKIDGQSGGTGWTNNWMENTNNFGEKVNDVVTSTSLAYTNFGRVLTTNGGALSSTGITSDDTRAFNNAGDTTLYYSFLMRHDTAGSGSADYGGLVINGTTPGTDYFVGDPGESDQIIIGQAGSGNGQVVSSTTLTTGTGMVVFLVAKVTINPSGADTVTLYINPVPGSAESFNTNTITKSNFDIGTALTGIELISGTYGAWTFDELRIGATFDDVVPAVAQPGTPNSLSTDGSFSDKVRVTWSPVSGASGYDVYRGTGNDFTLWTKLTASPLSLVTTQYDDTTAAPGTVYWYWVGANNSSWGTAFSVDAGFRTPTVANALNMTTQSNSQSIFFSLNGSNALQVFFNSTGAGAPAYTFPATLASLQLTLGNANKFVADFSHGNIVPAAGFTVTGVSGGTDEIKLIGTSLAQAFSINDTQAGITGSPKLTYANIATLTLSNLTATYTGTFTTITGMNVSSGAKVIYSSSGNTISDGEAELQNALSPEPLAAPLMTASTQLEQEDAPQDVDLKVVASDDLKPSDPPRGLLLAILHKPAKKNAKKAPVDDTTLLDTPGIQQAASRNDRVLVALEKIGGGPRS